MFSLKHVKTTRELRKDNKDIFFQLLNMFVKNICLLNISELHNFNHNIAKYTQKVWKKREKMEIRILYTIYNLCM